MVYAMGYEIWDNGYTEIQQGDNQKLTLRSWGGSLISMYPSHCLSALI